MSRSLYSIGDAHATICIGELHFYLIVDYVCALTHTQCANKPTSDLEWF